MYYLRPLLLACGLFLLVSACKTDPIDVQQATSGGGNTGNGSTGGTGNTADTALCFERDILPVFISNCARSGCHDAASSKDGYVFTSYETITARKFRAGDAANTELYKKITEDNPGKLMPPPPNPRLSDRQIALIGRWINEGAKNTGGCAPDCDSSRTGFSSGIRPLFDTYCNGCHSSAAPSGGIALDTYTGARAVAMNGRLIGAVTHSAGYSPMPKGGARLSDCAIAQLRGWIQAGAPNN